MNKLVMSILSLAFAADLGLAPALAAEGQADHAEDTPHYPIHKPVEQAWSFAGPFGTYDKGQLQRGLKIYKEVCSACHSMNLVSFRTLQDLGYSPEQVKAFAAKYEVQDGPNADGKIYMRKATPSDHFPAPFANNGAAPPDFSLIAKARGIERGFPQFLIDMLPVVGGYQEGGPDYIHALLTGYQVPPAGAEVAAGTHYNPYFANAAALAMAPPLNPDQVTYEDGTPQTVDQYAKDVSAFLMWAAEPHLEQRKRTGFMVMVFLAIFTMMIYLTKKSVYASKER